MLREQLQSTRYGHFCTPSVSFYSCILWREVALLLERLLSVWYCHILNQKFLLQETFCLTLSDVNSFSLWRFSMNLTFCDWEIQYFVRILDSSGWNLLVLHLLQTGGKQSFTAVAECAAKNRASGAQFDSTARRTSWHEGSSL